MPPDPRWHCVPAASSHAPRTPPPAQFAPPGKERRAPARSVRTAPAETASWPLITVGREQVALAPAGADELWLARIGFNFSAQASHAHIDGTIEWGAIVTLQQIDQAIAADRKSVV